MQVTTKPDAIYTVIFTPTYKKQLGWSGYARSFSAVGELGPFDILPGHENLVTVAVGNAIIVDERGKRFEIRVGRAVVEASENVLKVFVEY